MIHFLKGTVIAIDGAVITLDTHGVGYGITLSQTIAFQIGSEVALHIFFHWNQENGPHLFGFQTPQERQLFTLLLDCPGIGPKMALSLLNLSVAMVVQAIMTADYKTLSSASGVGTKKAEIIVMHLRNKLDKLALLSAADMHAPINVFKEVSDVLDSLGYTRPEIASALEHIRAGFQPRDTFDIALKRGLGFLVKNR